MKYFWQILKRIPTIRPDLLSHYFWGQAAFVVGYMVARTLQLSGVQMFSPKVVAVLSNQVVVAGKELADAWANKRETGHWRKGSHGVDPWDWATGTAGGLVILLALS